MILAANRTVVGKTRVVLAGGLRAGVCLASLAKSLCIRRSGARPILGKMAVADVAME